MEIRRLSLTGQPVDSLSILKSEGIGQFGRRPSTVAAGGKKLIPHVSEGTSAQPVSQSSKQKAIESRVSTCTVSVKTVSSGSVEKLSDEPPLTVSLPIKTILKATEMATARPETIKPILYKIPEEAPKREHPESLKQYLRRAERNKISLTEAAQTLGYPDRGAVKEQFINAQKQSGVLRNHFTKVDWQQASELRDTLEQIKADMAEQGANCVSTHEFLDYLAESKTSLYLWLKNLSTFDNRSITDEAKLWVNYHLWHSRIHFGSKAWAPIEHSPSSSREHTPSGRKHKRRAREELSQPRKAARLDPDEYTPDISVKEFDSLSRFLTVCNRKLHSDEKQVTYHQMQIANLQQQIRLHENELNRLESSIDTTKKQWNLAMHKLHFSDKRPIPKHLQGISFPPLSAAEQQDT